MKIGILSDSHGRIGAVRAAAKVFKEEEISTLLFCGDIGADEVVDQLRDFDVHYVLGNVDDVEEMPIKSAAKRFNHVMHDRFGELELEGIKIGFLHGDNEKRLASAISGGEFDLVCHGHTHQVRQEYVGKTLVLNPGALHRASPRSFAILELPTLEVRIIRLPEFV